MEERVYGRCVNKTGVALQVIDQMSISRCFTERELQDLMQNLQWVACDKCSKWRVLIGEVSEEALAAEWYCSMNTTDPINNNCIASEKSQQWYENHYFTNTGFEQSPADSPGKFSEEKFITKQTSEQTSNDEILQHLLGLTEEEKTTTLVSKHYFHEALMETTNSSEQLDKARQSMEMQKENEGVAATLTARTNNSNTADDGDKIETADAANGQAHMLDIASNATPPATKTAQVSTGDQSEIADVVLKNAQVLPAIGKATPPFPGRRQMLNTIGEAPLPFPIKVAQVSNGSQSQTFDVTEGQVLALPTAGEDASMSSRKMAHVLSCGQIEISDVAKRQTQELPPAGKVPSSTSIKRDRILAKSILCPSERMSIPDGENVCASNAVSANASDPAHEKFCRISPTSFDGDSADGIKVKVKGMSPLKLTGKATNQPRSSPAQQKKPPDAAAAALTGTCEHEAIDLCDTSDDDT